MIHSFTVTNYLGDRITIDLRKPELSGFLVKSVSGLGPAKATVNTTDIATGDGAMLNSARLNQRNIVFQLIFDGNSGETIEELRQKSYRYFPVKQKIEIAVKTDCRYARVTGYVESNEPDIFSAQEGTQISVICPDPFFYSTGKDGNMVTVFYGVEAAFEFPFSNDSTSEPQMIFGEIRANKQGVVAYPGDAETGVTMYLHALGPVSGIRIYNLKTRKVLAIDTTRLEQMTGKGFDSGDDMVICTVRGDKSVSLIRDGTTYNVLNCMARQSSWLSLVKGDNLFAFTADSGASNLQFRIENRVVYEGV